MRQCRHGDALSTTRDPLRRARSTKRLIRSGRKLVLQRYRELRVSRRREWCRDRPALAPGTDTIRFSP